MDIHLHTLKIWTLATVVLYPLAGIIIINCFNIALWDILNKIFLIMILGGMVVSIYIIREKIRIIKLPAIVVDVTNLQHSSWEIRNDAEEIVLSELAYI